MKKEELIKNAEKAYKDGLIAVSSSDIFNGYIFSLEGLKAIVNNPDSETVTNRESKKKHIQLLAEKIKKGVQLPPIVVEKNTLIIVDGNHRRCAYAKVWEENPKLEMIVPVFFIDLGGNIGRIREETLAINADRKNWIASDYSNLRKNDKGFKRFIDFCMEDKWTLNSKGTKPAVSYASWMMGFAKNGIVRDMSFDFNELTENRYDLARKVRKFGHIIADRYGFNGNLFGWGEAFIKAIYQFVSKNEREISATGYGNFEEGCGKIAEEMRNTIFDSIHIDVKKELAEWFDIFDNSLAIASRKAKKAA